VAFGSQFFSCFREADIADIAAIRTALATRIGTATGLRTMPEARDMISPPVAVILPGDPLVTYGITLDGAVTIALRILILISDAAPSEKVQRALDAYLGIGAGTTASSIPAAIMADPTLGGAVHFCEPISVQNYGLVSYAGIDYFGGRINCTIGAI
jgi:hypothetical protein